MVSYQVNQLNHRRYSLRLNPYCSGQWSRTHGTKNASPVKRVVLILIVVDNGLVHSVELTTRQMSRVLILIVVDNGLVRI